jgi:hypothetical protein
MDAAEDVRGPVAWGTGRFAELGHTRLSVGRAHLSGRMMRDRLIVRPDGAWTAHFHLLLSGAGAARFIRA